VANYVGFTLEKNITWELSIEAKNRPQSMHSFDRKLKGQKSVQLTQRPGGDTVRETTSLATIDSSANGACICVGNKRASSGFSSGGGGIAVCGGDGECGDGERETEVA
jgi:hypothetical protein